MSNNSLNSFFSIRTKNKVEYLKIAKDYFFKSFFIAFIESLTLKEVPIIACVVANLTVAEVSGYSETLW